MGEVVRPDVRQDVYRNMKRVLLPIKVSGAPVDTKEGVPPLTKDPVRVSRTPLHP